MDVNKYKYRRADYVTAWKIIECLRTYGLVHRIYLMLETDMNMKSVVPAPIGCAEGPDLVRGKYYVVDSDGRVDIISESEFTMEYEKVNSKEES